MTNRTGIDIKISCNPETAAVAIAIAALVVAVVAVAPQIWSNGNLRMYAIVLPTLVNPSRTCIKIRLATLVVQST